MTDSQSSYLQIFKSTSLFSGMQVITILISIVCTKSLAVLLGTAGVGTLGLFNAPMGLIASLTGLGISYSAIRDISEAAGTEHEQRVLCRAFASGVCVHANLVQSEGKNPVLETFSMEQLLELWEHGKRINLQDFYDKPMNITQVQKYTFV